ncbi:MAG: LysR family transcriptional regulator [Myxococcales bacterium]|nr:LysR family transcriptional regulator [Myxococcales bacterium]
MLALCEAPVDLNEVSTFVKVVEAGGFTAAAEELELPKSTISRRIARLEERLGVRLLERTTRKMRLTEAGQAYFDQVAVAIATLHSASSAAEEQQDSPRGLLKITAPVDLGHAFLGDVLVRFTKRYPEVHVQVELTGRVVDLIREGFDVALRAGQLQDSSLVARRLGGTHIGLYASPEYLAKRGTPKTPEQLRAHDFVIHNGVVANGKLPLVGPNGEQVTIDVDGALSGNDFTFVLRAVEASGGIGLVPKFGARRACHESSLVQVLPEWTRQGGGLHLVYPSARFLPAKTKAFRDFMLELLDELGLDD